METKNVQAQKDTLIDFSGLRTGHPLDKATIIKIVAAIIIPFLTYAFVDLSAYGEKAGLALGLIISLMILLIGGVVGPGVGGCIMTLMGLATGLLDTSAISGGPLFFQFVGLCIIGYGVECTPFGQRLAYIILKRFASKPKLIVLGMLLVAAVLSSTISNFATVVLMGALTNKLLEQMGEQKGKSTFAAACMLASVVGANIGGGGFIQGSIGVNIYSVGQITANTQGAFTITPAQWASVGWLQLLFVIPVCWLIILACNKFVPSEVHVLEPDYYQNHLKEMGHISGSEVRWLLMVVSLIIFMLLGFNTNMLMVIYTILAIFPGIGITNSRDAFGKAIPWEIVVSAATMSNIGAVFSKSGLSTWVSALLSPVLKGMSPLVLMIVLSLIIAVMALFLVGGTYANIAIGVTLMAPVVEAMGLHPCIILFPVILSVNYMMGFFVYTTVLPCYNYGWFEKNKITQVGTFCGVAAAIISAVVTYFAAPALWGVSLYI